MESKTNKEAFFNYEILEKFEAGLKLIGSEVKSLKNNHYSLQGAYVTVKNEEAWLMHANIAPYQPKNMSAAYNPERPRKLLLTQKELKYLQGKTQQKGLTIVPLRVYNKHGQIKLEIALAKGKHKSDKRQVLKQRVAEREISRELRSK
ncbi:MAG: SsrA-binding protein SmpB [Parcubacteria group bacterium]|nr:SsrA-binding protein SmpB [Parcubacteria group bacterium]